jgi:hypothetical protein
MAASTQMAPDANGIRMKGFLGTADEMTKVAEVLAPKTVEWVRSLTDAEIIPMGVKALGDIADDILVLDEIRQRFRKRSIEGYANWTEFIEKNSKYGIRTIQKRLATVNGKDETKVNDRFKVIEAETAAPAVVITDAVNFPAAKQLKQRPKPTEELLRLQGLAKNAGYYLTTSARDEAYDLLGLTAAQVEKLLGAQ